jgi:hypothetical protein
VQEDEISRAVKLFLGFRSASFPRQDRALLVAEFGASRGAELEREVLSLLEELARIEVDWGVHSLASAGTMAREFIRARNPDLFHRGTSRS